MRPTEEIITLEFAPAEDITAYELAKLLSIPLTRHFRVIG